MSDPLSLAPMGAPGTECPGLVLGTAAPVVLELFKPPSANRIWRTGRGRTYLAPGYAKWRRDAGWQLMAYRAAGLRKITTPFEAHIVVERKKRRGDIDNRIKSCLDVLQHSGIIANDSLCRKVSAEWGDTELGCRITLTVAA